MAGSAFDGGGYAGLTIVPPRAGSGAGGGGAGGDPLWSDVILYMKMGGVDGSTSFVDDGPLALTIGNSGRTISNAIAYEGATSLKEDNTGYTYVDGTASTPLPGVLTVEAWVYWTATPVTTPSNLWNIVKSSGNGMICYRTNAADKKVYVDDGFGALITGTTVSNNAWHHIAMTRDGGNAWRLWIDGAQAGSTISNSDTWFYNGVQSLRIACADSGVWNLGNTAATYMDLLRITKACRYTTTFTPGLY